MKFAETEGTGISNNNESSKRAESEGTCILSFAETEGTGISRNSPNLLIVLGLMLALIAPVLSAAELRLYSIDKQYVKGIYTEANQSFFVEGMINKTSIELIAQNSLVNENDESIEKSKGNRSTPYATGEGTGGGTSYATGEGTGGGNSYATGEGTGGGTSYATGEGTGGGTSYATGEGTGGSPATGEGTGGGTSYATGEGTGGSPATGEGTGGGTSYATGEGTGGSPNASVLLNSTQNIAIELNMNCESKLAKGIASTSNETIDLTDVQVFIDNQPLTCN